MACDLPRFLVTPATPYGLNGFHIDKDDVAPRPAVESEYGDSKSLSSASTSSVSLVSDTSFGNAVNTATPSQLRRAVKRVSKKSPVFLRSMAKAIKTPCHATAPSSPSDDSARESLASDSEPEAVAPWTCARCNERFHRSSNTVPCTYHSGVLCEETWQFVAPMREERTIAMWSCCMQDVDSEGCQLSSPTIDFQTT
ncbi:hypothetical protein FISHEDRAFT_77932 [Fistulina hepatica ATCC 64428]|nr:hypothetical protein FISHEDRAFT_77932 [Fistulina hepatica ATCC 64428]